MGGIREDPTFDDRRGRLATVGGAAFLHARAEDASAKLPKCRVATATVAIASTYAAMIRMCTSVRPPYACILYEEYRYTDHEKCCTQVWAWLCLCSTYGTVTRAAAADYYYYRRFLFFGVGFRGCRVNG